MSDITAVQPTQKTQVERIEQLEQDVAQITRVLRTLLDHNASTHKGKMRTHSNIIEGERRQANFYEQLRLTI